MTISNETFRIPGSSPAPTPKPLAPQRTSACRRDYDEAKAALLEIAGRPLGLNGNQRHDDDQRSGRMRELADAHKKFEAVYAGLMSDAPSAAIVVDHAEILREASALSSAVHAEQPPRRAIETRIDSGGPEVIHLVDIHEREIGTVEIDDGVYEAFAANGRRLGQFHDRKSAVAAVRASAT
jgi:hypothetical protein